MNGPAKLATVRHTIRSADAGGHFSTTSGSQTGRERLPDGGERGRRVSETICGYAPRPRASTGPCLPITAITTRSFDPRTACVVGTLAKLTKTDLAAIKSSVHLGHRSRRSAIVLIAAPATPAKTVLKSTCHPTSRRAWGSGGNYRSGAELGLSPCGLGARNTLRLEAGMALYGHEISGDQCL